MDEDTKTIFLDRLTKVLNGNIKEKSQTVLENEAFCEALKQKLSRIMEKINKLDFLSDDFELSSFVHFNINNPTERMKEQMDKPWLKNKLTIGLLGHFNSGKTTALNLIFDENFATCRRENTALATYLVNGKNTDVLTIVDKSGKSQEISIEDSYLFDYQAGISNFPFARIFEYVVKESKNKLLNQITFIDTPGLHSSIEHSEPTIHVIPNCDVIFWFINLTGSLSYDDIVFIKSNIKDKDIYLVLSFADDVECLDASIQTVLDGFSNEDIEIKDYFLLGSAQNIQEDFKLSITNGINNIINEIKVYNPYGHIYSIMCESENLLVDYQKELTKQFNKLDRETDQISNTFQSSQAKFVTAYNNCINRIENTIYTFNDRCSGALFCGGASVAISNNLNSIICSLEDMGKAYSAIDVSKLIEYGQQSNDMNSLQNKINIASELIKEIQELKKIFD